MTKDRAFFRFNIAKKTKQQNWEGFLVFIHECHTCTAIFVLIKFFNCVALYD